MNYTENEIDNYSLYMDFVRYYTCDEINLNNKLKDKLEFVSLEIKRTDVIIDKYNTGDKWIFDVSYKKESFNIEIISFQKWSMMMNRNKKFKQLGL